MKQPSITVVLTTKNDERTIKMCVDSLLRQTYRNYKIYITIAKTSTDKTYSILRKYGKRIRLEWIDGNRPRSYNKMLAKVNTEYVAFTDGDAVVDKNWLKVLIASFEPGIVAVGGMIKNPKAGNRLQYLVGKELEHRFSKLPKYVSRLPTMNLCVRTKYAKREKFDEHLRVAQETEWGYRLNKYGRTLFNPKAVVWHYHRATWKSYFKQQYLYGQNVPRVYLSKRNIGKVSGDEISNPWPAINLAVTGLLMILSLFSSAFFLPFSIFFLLTFISYLFQAAMITGRIFDAIYLTAIFTVRNIAWILGIVSGIPKVLIR